MKRFGRPLQQIAAWVMFAQKRQLPRLFNTLKEHKNREGFMVLLLSALGGGYGHDILQDNKPVLHQFRNR